MSFDLKSLLRPHIAGLKPYSSARDEYAGKEGIFLDANENPYGSTAPGNFNRYPDPYQIEIKEKLAEIKKVKPDQVFLGNGSDEAIDLLLRAFCNPGKDNMIILPPTYGMYEVSASINDVEIKRVPLSEDFQLQPRKILEAVNDFTKVIFICSPNNPTGNLMKKKDIYQVLENFNGIVVVDEAYIDFAPEVSMVAELEKYPNLVVIQTFSKAWGLAALRIGMGFASTQIISILNLIKPPYNISGLTQEKVLEALSLPNAVYGMVGKIMEGKNELVRKLEEMDEVIQVYHSDANFVLVKIPQAKEIYHYLIEEKIIIRDRSKVTLCEDCLRISVGTPEENEAFLTAFASYTKPTTK
ncbi:histidinol-phosphate transaminase [Litoribacter alkaliphilus]|uniref:Histidinol-phosphate aminotransferase n=1 Tax=Litoribacter ruber TaxID=702568 RepID=A0AAP2CJT8_9BACT|nr:histidinol-phosphate transaminase [Litoribacter alkaliphilus]MBS9523092.1 histidinol-phosphate transaminase [Litoribacter alkaliphilus]